MGEACLRVAMVALDFNREGGSERRTGRLVDHLVAGGHEVHLVGARIRGHWDSRVVLRSVETTPRPHWLEVVQFCRRAAALVRRERFDVVHNQIRPFVPGVVTVGGGCHRFYLDEVLPQERGRLQAALKRLAPLHRILLRLERRAYAAGGSPFVITNSRLSRDGILRYYPMPPDRVVVAYNGVDAGRFSPAQRAAWREPRRASLGVGPDDLVVLLVGGGFVRKGLRTLLTALTILRARALRPRLVAVGRGPAPGWSRRVRRMGLADQVTFTGQVPDPETYYAAADVFALPTFYDPFANATLEAMASGLPVITSRWNGAAEILEPGTDSLVVERPGDAGAFAEAIAGLSDPLRRSRMGARARQTALKYSWDGPLEATLKVYRAAASERA